MELSFWDMVLRLFLAISLGAVIGWERRSKGKVAGLRTMMMVSLGSAAFTLAGIGAMEGIYAAEQQAGIESTLRLDTSRVIAGIVGGIGFIGAGTIIQARGRVHGVTTASCIWVAASVGVGCGLGLFQLAVVVSIFAVLALQIYFWSNRHEDPDSDEV
ncbi:MAG: MgtC/SapB family protein [Planctomycetota bacterium]|nr:MgtC/SapB family protein [Planctomycetota bacterium]